VQLSEIGTYCRLDQAGCQGHDSMAAGVRRRARGGAIQEVIALSSERAYNSAVVVP
jgi:hypothetical protein